MKLRRASCVVCTRRCSVSVLEWSGMLRQISGRLHGVQERCIRLLKGPMLLRPRSRLTTCWKRSQLKNILQSVLKAIQNSLSTTHPSHDNSNSVKQIHSHEILGMTRSRVTPSSDVRWLARAPGDHRFFDVRLNPLRERRTFFFTLSLGGRAAFCLTATTAPPLPSSSNLLSIVEVSHQA